MKTPPTLVREIPVCFPETYETCRCRFLEAAGKTAPPTRVFSCPLNDRLATETLWIGPDSARNVLVLISGTHGVEGRVGAAIQLDLLNRLPSLPENTALLLIFALNPHGFEHNRRCDGDGIDLNRNFIDFSRPLPANPGYEEIAEAVYLPEAERAESFARFRAKHGERAFEIAVSGGQYSDPSGPFFGGSAPGHGNRAAEQIIAHYSLPGRRLAVVDIHSGLGPYGHGELICDHEPGTAGFRQAMQWYGAAVTAPAEGTSSSVRKEGLLDYRWHRLMKTEGCFVTLEFGTYSIDRLFNTVLNDHAAWKNGDSDATQKSAAAMREHFCPEDANWRELILIKGRQVIQQAFNGLNHDRT